MKRRNEVQKLISVANLGVIIQGPILSRGRTLNDLSPRNYDASENINQMFDRVTKVGANPILVTWETEDTSYLDSNVMKNILRIRMPDTTRAFRVKNNITANSKYKQFYSVLMGVEALSARNIEYILKIRTDINLPIELLISHISQIDEKSIENRIVTPLLNFDKPNMFYDFYYFSTTTTMRNFHELMMNSKEICSNVHYDVFYRWGLRKKKLWITDIPSIYPKYPRFTKKQLLLIHNIWENSFGVLPRQIWRELEWRGEAFDLTSVKPAFIFSENNLQLRIKDILEIETSRTLRFEITPIISFFLASNVEDRVRKIILLFRRIRNKSRSIIYNKSQ